MSEYISGTAPGTVLKSGERNYGVDLLRIVAMLYVVILHVIGPGGIVEAAAIGSAHYQVAWVLEVWAFCAVDIFALVSGYVSYSEHAKKVKWSNYVLLWLQVVVYGAAVTLVFNCLHPELVTKQDLFMMFFPVTNRLYWYLNAYTGLFVLMPLLDAGLRNCPVHTLKKIFVVVFVVFSVYETVIRGMVMENGYSFAWVLLLYVLGGIIRKCGLGEKWRASYAWIGIAVCGFLAWFFRLYGPEFSVFKTYVGRYAWICYLSPMVLGAAVFHVIAFSKLKVGEKARKVIAFASPSAFTVYILNCHWVIWDYVMTGNFAGLAAKSVPVMVLGILAFSFAFVVISILIDRVRIFLFDLFHVRQIVERLLGIAEKAVSVIAERI